jgi:putative endonuclease
MVYYCYMVECADGSYYTGWSTDPTRREHEHNHTIRGARYTRMHRPVQLVYVEAQPDRRTAMRRELALKRLSHPQKKVLIESYRSSKR